jgi:hypothetical protein
MSMPKMPRPCLVGPYAKLAFHLKRLSRALLARVTLADAKKMGYR